MIERHRSLSYMAETFNIYESKDPIFFYKPQDLPPPRKGPRKHPIKDYLLGLLFSKSQINPSSLVGQCHMMIYEKLQILEKKRI